MLQTSSHVLQAANPTYAYVAAFVDELRRAGVHHAVICPGSRSTPLAMCIVAQPAIRTWMHVDERSAAFFALGMAKRLAQPVALICTSGTAAANFLPALVEARLTHVPLLVLTADRPPELRDCGAPQAIDQNRLYGTHVKWFVEVALPEASNEALRYIRTLACRAAALALAVPAGPVHLNMPFREPLTPDPWPDQPLPPPERRDALAWYGRPDNAPYIAVEDAPAGSLSATVTARLAAQLEETERGLIIVGPAAPPGLAQPLARLAKRLGYPILADPLSQLRCGPHDREAVLAGYDAFLRLAFFTERFAPQLVLRFGAMPTSKPLLLYLKRYAACRQIVVDSNYGWQEPTQLAAEMLHADAPALCEQLLAALPSGCDRHTRFAGDISWFEAWRRVDQITRETMLTAMRDFSQLFEGRVFPELNELLPADATLYAGNSMPVRDMDTFFWGNTRPLRIVGNRGASGIDGVISSALGYSAASQQDEPVVLVIGDLSFFHDLNGLLAAHLHHLNLTVILVNNNGGGIFSFLPQAAYPEHFEQLFGTPTGLDFAPVVQMYGGQFQRVRDWEEFRSAVKQGIAAGGLHVIEVPTERASNVALHRRLWQMVEQALRAHLPALSEE
ncbi:MAG: 2-succinyl-5-enolpyruvyl-6-hydroxy-3-cyclohexene-1-carboxylic-acid synthase [Ktedonobacteraceae bacterium]|nr:2-succinyl-5-enolpyruvyl-6-hydroxy-3-cyclohexene-1-carboxylic-acid synthase [Ktedonobacteraceae bacterium]